jgi:hypothetical protein
MLARMFYATEFSAVRQQRFELYMDVEDWDQISRERVSVGLHDYFKCGDNYEVLR